MPDAGRVGRSRDGGLAEYMTMRAENVFPFERAGFAAAAVAMDAVATPWRALLVRGRLERGERVVVAGAGGLGLNAIQVAVDAGASVAAIDPDATARAKALAAGAELAVATAGEWSGDAADIGLEASGRREGLEALVACVRPGGRIVCCGYAPGSAWELDSMRVVLSELALIGSRASSREDARAALAAVEAGEIVPEIAATYELDDVNDRAGATARGRSRRSPRDRDCDRERSECACSSAGRAQGAVGADRAGSAGAGAGEVVIRVRACGICHSDVALQEGYYDFASFPRVPGHEIAGVVEAVGEGVDVARGRRARRPAVAALLVRPLPPVHPRQRDPVPRAQVHRRQRRRRLPGADARVRELRRAVA